MNERLEQARQLGRRIDIDWHREDIEAQLARLPVRQRSAARSVSMRATRSRSSARTASAGPSSGGSVSGISSSPGIGPSDIR